VAAADLRVERGVGRQRDAQQLVGRVAIEGHVEDPAARDLLARTPILAREPEQLGDRVAQRSQQGEPAAEGLGARRCRLVQPEEIVRQVEFTGAARNRAAVLDRREEFRIAQRLQPAGARGREVAAQAAEVREQRRQSRRVDPRAVLVFAQQREVPLQFLQYVAAQVAAQRDREDVEQARDRGATAPLTGLLVVEEGLRIQEIEAQERAHALVQRLFEHGCVAAVGAFLGAGHQPIVLDVVVARKPARAGAGLLSGLRGQPQVALVQRRDLRGQRSQASVVHDHIVSELQPARAGRLGGEDAGNFLGAGAVTLPEAGALRGFLAVHHQHAVIAPGGVHLRQQRIDDDLVGPAGRGHEFGGAAQDGRVQQSLQFPSLLRVRENAAAQRASIQAAIGLPQLWAKALDDPGEQRRAGRDHVARDPVQVDDRHAALGKQARHRALAAGDASGEADDHRPNNPR
jgi:hypothetical protein